MYDDDDDDPVPDSAAFAAICIVLFLATLLGIILWRVLA
jgi:hypothetical protein